MNRTSTALRRLGVPVLAATLAVPASMLFGGTAFAAAATLSHTPANPQTGQTVTENVAGATAGQVVTLTITPAASSAFWTSGPGANSKTTSCTVSGAGTCSATLTDTVAETVQVTASDAADTFTPNPDNITFAAANGTYSFSPNPAYGTASPTNSGGSPNGGAATQSVTYTPGAQSGANGANSQTITLTVSGSAYFLPQANQPAQPAGAGPGNTLTVNQSNNKQATCVTGTAPGANQSQSCTYKVADTTSEGVTVTATAVANGSTDTSTPAANGQINFAGIQWTNCASNMQNTAVNCATQQPAGTTQKYTVTYKEAGQPAAGRSVQFTLQNNNAAFPSNQPSGSQLNTIFIFPTVQCTTDSNGQCSVNVSTNGTQSTGGDVIFADTQNTLPYPTSEAAMAINFVASGTVGRLVQTSSSRLTPGTQADNVNIPGDVVQNTYTVYNCTANTTTGTNACLGNQPLAGQTLTVAVDHGFFTPPCSSTIAPAPSYAQCTFDPAAAPGGAVGGLKSLGNSTTVTTNANGQFTVALAIARDQAFDQNGNLIATVTATQGSTTLTESVGPGNSSSSTTCNTVGQSGAPNNSGNGSGNNGAPQAGCPTGTPWTTDARPLNGASVKIVSIPASSSEAALSDSSTNNVPESTGTPANPSQGTPSVRTFVVQATDQFGNLTSDRNNTDNTTTITLAKTGVGDLYHCGTNYSTTSPCNGGNSAGTGNVTNSSGGTTTTYKNVRGSYLAPFSSQGFPVQDRFQTTSQQFNGVSPQTGTQTLTATWTAPTTTFNTYTAGTSNSPAVATYTAGTKTLTDVVTINYYNPSNVVATFSTTPGNTVAAGTVVTVSATVKDQFGNPQTNDNVQFIRSGPQTQNGTSCSATNSFQGTNAQGQAGFSFTCTNPSTQVVTIVVQDQAGNELARGTQTINFTGQSVGRTAIAMVLKCISPRKHVVRCKVSEAPKIAGLWVTLYRHVNGKNLRIGSKRVNSNGVAYFTIRNLRSHSWFAAQAFHAGTRTTKPAHTGVNGTRVR